MSDWRLLCAPPADMRRILLANYQLDRIVEVARKDKRPKAIRQILNTLPTTVYSIYEKILVSAPSSCRRELRRLLLLCCFLETPVTLEEASEFAIVEPGTPFIDPDSRFSQPRTSCYFARASSLYRAPMIHIAVAEDARFHELLRRCRKLEPKAFSAISPQHSRIFNVERNLR